MDTSQTFRVKRELIFKNIAVLNYIPALKGCDRTSFSGKIKSDEK